uniref:Chalcone-flavonone isomerase family protein n=1 Tax=Aegilops tauschii subsp. strangulata TaxID=200361 RepID=A0A452XNE7_AEGTS
MMVASVVPSPLAGPALARPGRTRLLPPCDLPAGSSLQSASGCRIARGGARRPQHISFAAGGGAEGDAFVVEGATNVKFSRELTVPGHKEPLIILGTGYRDKFFVKVYAAAFYVDISIGLDTEQWRKKVSVSTDQGPSQVDVEVKSATVNYALYDGFFGSSPVSPTLRSSTAQLLEAILTK